MLTVIPYPLALIGLFALGTASGGLSNLTSGGAGVLTIYVLSNFLGLLLPESTGTVLAASTVIVLIGVVSFYKKKQIEMRLAVTVGLAGVVGAFLAARLASSPAIQSTTLENAFGVFTLALACYTTYAFAIEGRRRQTDQAVPALRGSNEVAGPAHLPSRWARTDDPAALLVQIAKGATIGLATGLFGVGLASISVVLFMLLFKLETNVVLGTSLLASFFRYLGGSIGYLTAGQIDTFLFIILVLGGGIGSILGAKFVLGGKAREASSRDNYIKLLQVAILVFVGFAFLLK